MNMPAETTIHTLRHAHTSYNAEKRYAGTIDVPLNEVGMRDARAASAKLAGIKFDVVVTSTLKRTIETANLLVDGAVPLVKSELCNERNFGIMEGLTWDEVQNLTPPVLFIEVGNDLHSVNPKGGEPFEEVWERAKRFRHFLFTKYRGSSILVISHGVFLQMFHGVLRGLSCIESLATYPANLELTTFRLSGNRLLEEKTLSLNGVEQGHW
jgi:broad specificity phosphatase PhoE